MAIHPTCGILPLQKATKCVAFLDLILGLVGIIWFVYMLQVYDLVSLEPFENPEKDTPEAAKLDNLGSIRSEDHLKPSKVTFAVSHKVITLLLSSLYNIVNVLFFVVLIIGAYKKSIGLCLTWFYIRCAILVFKLIIFTIYIIAKRPLFGQIPYMIFILFHIYGIWVVNRFIEEMRSERAEEKATEMRLKQKQMNDESERDEIERIQHLRQIAYHIDNPTFQDEHNNDKHKL